MHLSEASRPALIEQSSQKYSIHHFSNDSRFSHAKVKGRILEATSLRSYKPRT